jgi:hypothetical protein
MRSAFIGSIVLVVLVVLFSEAEENKPCLARE